MLTESEALATLDRINLWLNTKGGPVTQLFPSTHLDLPEGQFSTYIEGWYYDEMYGMCAVSQAILNGEITLPPHVQHGMYSHCEMYFYSDRI